LDTQEVVTNKVVAAEGVGYFEKRGVDVKHLKELICFPTRKQTFEEANLEETKDGNV